MGELLARAAGEQNVLDAWHVTLSRLSEEPAPRAEVAAFSENLLSRLSELQTALAAGTWCPGPVRRVELPRRDGGVRVLGIPSLADRVAERAIAAVLTPIVDPHLQPDSFGFRPGLGVPDAVNALQERIDEGEKWVIRTDLADCFDRISRRGCVRAIGALIEDDDLLTLLGRCVHRSSRRNASTVGLLQGSPLSPLLVNTYLDGMDRELWDAGVSVIRYVDDIAATAHSESDAAAQLEAIRRAATTRGLALSEAKTAVVRAEIGFDYLGRRVGSAERYRGNALVDPSRATVHVTTRGSALRSRGTRFVVTRPGEPTLRYPATRTRMIVCNDRVLISSAALALASRHGVGVAVIDAREGTTAFLSAESDRQAVRAAQLRARDDAGRTLALARALVTGKIVNSRVLLSRTKRRRALVSPEVLERMDHLARRVRNATEVPQLMGIEGAASRHYFQALAAIVPGEWGFTGRNRRPPRDAVNALLSYGYTVLIAEARRAVELAGLDPTVGFLHGPHRGRPSLALDLAEEFRALIVDTTVLRLISTGAVKPDGFSDGGPAGCRMDMPTKRALIEELERRLLTRVIHPVRRAPMAYRQAMEEQAVALARAVTGSLPAYHPMPWR